MRRLVCGPMLFAMLLGVSPAWADVAPPECEEREYEHGSHVCETCEASTSNPNACSEQYEDTMFEFKCASSDWPVWWEVWCRDTSLPEPCSLEHSSVIGLNCEECQATYQVPEICSDRYADTDYTQRCRTDGIGAWSEVWCTDSPLEQGTGDPTQTGGCQGASEGVPMQAWIAFLPILGLVLLRVRRHYAGRS